MLQVAYSDYVASVLSVLKLFDFVDMSSREYSVTVYYLSENW